MSLRKHAKTINADQLQPGMLVWAYGEYWDVADVLKTGITVIATGKRHMQSNSFCWRHNQPLVVVELPF
jgi:hypothetical protein